MSTIKKNPLLSTNNVKTMKGEKLGYKTYILYMSSYKDNSKGINLCSHASQGCATACLVGSGMGGLYTNVQQGRRNKSERFINNRHDFLLDLFEEITKIVKKAENDFIPTIRLNGTTDIRWEKFKVINSKNIFELFPEVQFYDYTKNHLRFNGTLPKNYHLTFSRSETNNDKAMELLKRGYNVAMVFDKTPLEYKGFEVVNGDETDLRFLDGTNVIVGLKYKNLTGKGANNNEAFESGFAIRLNTKVVKAKKVLQIV
jgi:hypothetical protein